MPIVSAILIGFLGLSFPVLAFIEAIDNMTFAHLPEGLQLKSMVQGDLFFIPFRVETDSFSLFIDTQTSDSPEVFVTSLSEPMPQFLLPLMGKSNGSLCVSINFFVESFPCAFFGWVGATSNAMWVVNSISGQSLPIQPNPLPFACSNELPCSMRTPDPTDKEIGGCIGSSAKASDTLLVVTWNGTYYLFKPLLYFAGKGAMYSVATGWPVGVLDYNAGISFATVIGQSGPMCTMNLIHVNGTVEVFSVDDNEPLSSTGLRRLAVMSPTQSSPGQCLPSAQIIPSPPILSGTIHSVTCASGEGWLWRVDKMWNVTLAGYFNITPPLSAQTSVPLIVDIAIMQVQPESCRPGLLTAVALLGVGLGQSVPWQPSPTDGNHILSLSTFLSGMGAPSNGSFWLTHETVNSTEVEGRFTIEGTDQYLRSGMGWVLPKTLPAAAINVSDCGDVTYPTLRWLASVAVYAAVTSDYHALLSPVNGLIATSWDLDIIDNTVLRGGILVSGPTRLRPGTGAFTRYPSSPNMTSAILQFMANGASPQIHLLGTSSGGMLSPIIVQPALKDAKQWCWYALENSFPFIPFSVSIQYTLPIYSTVLALNWFQGTPIVTATDIASNTQAYLFGAGDMDFTSTVGVSYPFGEALSSFSADGAPAIIICHGHTVTAYDTTVGYPIWSFDGLSDENGDICSSGKCGCPDGQRSIYLTESLAFVLVVFEDYILNTSGVAILNLYTGSLVSSFPTSQPAALFNECGALTTFGTIIEVPLSDGFIAFAWPVVGARCILVSVATDVAFHWGVFVATGETVAFSSRAAYIGTQLLVSEQPSYVGPEYGGRVFGFDVNIMWQLLQTRSTIKVFGTNPTFIIANSMSFVVMEELIVVVRYNGTAYTDNVPYYHICFLTFNGGGDLLWSTSNLTPEVIEALPPSVFEAFTTVQNLDSGIMTWVCVAAWQLVCMIVSPQPSNVMLYPRTFQCVGPPSASINRFLIWATEGYPPICFPIDRGDAVTWQGISSNVYFGNPINQTSCTDAIVANNVLLLRCSFDNEATMRLVLVDAHSGYLIYGYGPVVGPEGFSVSLDGQRITYLGEETKTLVTLQLKTVTSQIVVPLNVTVCGVEGESAYVFNISDELLTATNVPYDPNASALTSTFYGNYTASEDYAFFESYDVSLDSLVSLVGNPQMLAALGPSLMPTIAGMLTDDGIAYIAAVNPTYITNANGAITTMAASACIDCLLDCPTFCTLNTLSGVQTQYTGRMQSIDSITKPTGSSSYNPASVVSYPVPYSGQVSLNLLRFRTTIPPAEQQLEACYSSNLSATTMAPSGRYCLATGGPVSVIELVEGRPSLVATYSDGAGAIGTGPRALYSGYLAWTPMAVRLVMNELGLVGFLTQQKLALPPWVGSQQGIAYVNGSGLMGDEVLNVSTDVGVLLYTSKACANTTSGLPALLECPTSFFRFSRDMIDESLVTIAWDGLGGSNWGIGFISAGYQVSLSKILRKANDGEAVNCTLEMNTNPLCGIVCQPTSSCTSQMYYAFGSFLSLRSWLPTGSFVTDGGPCSIQGGAKLDFAIRMYGSKDRQALITSEINGTEVIMYSTALVPSAAFGATFTFSRCVFFTLRNVVAQPFGWLAICAVKSLLVTFGFYLAEHWVRGRERQRNALRDRMARLAAEIDEATGLEEDCFPSTHLQELLVSREPEAINWKDGEREDKGLRRRQVANVRPELAGMAAEYERCEAKAERLQSCGRSRSIVDIIVSLVASLSSYRHPLERAGQGRVIRDNMLPKHLDEASLTELLMFVLKEDRRNMTRVQSFALYYESHLCRNAAWVVRQQPLEYTGSNRLSSFIGERLSVVHDSLREVYKCFKTAQFDTASIELPSASTSLLQRTKVTSHVSEAGSEELQRLVSAFNALHDTEPASFEYAVLGTRHMEERLQPSALLLILSLAQSVVTILVYVIDVHIRSLATPLTALQMYECVCFMTFNSSLPSTVLVGAVLHSDLSPTMQATDPRGWLTHIFKSPFVLATVLLLSPPLITHIIPGLLLYCWVLVPPFAVAVIIEHMLRRSARRPSRLLLAARVVSRIAILLTTSIAFSVAFNVADGFMWKKVRGDDVYATGSYIQQGYLSALEQDYNDRSMACVWEHLFDTISNFLQMGFLLV